MKKKEDRGCLETSNRAKHVEAGSNSMIKRKKITHKLSTMPYKPTTQNNNMISHINNRLMNGITTSHNSRMTTSPNGKHPKTNASKMKMPLGTRSSYPLWGYLDLNHLHHTTQHPHRAYPTPSSSSDYS